MRLAIRVSDFIPAMALFLLASLVLVLPPANAEEATGLLGVSAYKQKNYPQAEKYLAKALKAGQYTTDQAAANDLFYLGLTYARTNRLTQARQSFEQVIQMVPETDPLARKSRNNITYITSAQMVAVNSAASASQVVKTTMAQGGQNNYLAHVLFNGKVVRFDEKKMPLKVYIESGAKIPGWTQDYKRLVTVACRNWQASTANRVRFLVVQKPDNADIVVRWRQNFQDNLLGVSPFQIVGNMIIRSDVTLALNYPENNQRIPMAELQAIATHEFGHAIGIKGHSPYANDIMYFSRNGHQPTTLSQRDINTMKLLYKTVADVQNSSTMSTAQTQQYVELFNQGIAAQKAGNSARADQLYRQAIQLAKTAPEAKFNLGVLLINEGRKAVEQNNLAKAVANYREAEGLFSSILSLGNINSASQGQMSNADVEKNLRVARYNLQLVQSHQ